MSLKNLLLSEAIGDIAGSVYEFHPEKDERNIHLLNDRTSYTDDTVCTFAVAEAFLHGLDVAETLARRCVGDPHRGYGAGFRAWIYSSDHRPYNSFGNGSAMRCSAAGFLARNEEECIQLATRSAECTHNHPEGIKGAVATALAVFYLMQGHDKAYVRANVLHKYYPGLKDWTVDEIYPYYTFDETCQGTVPVSLIAFLESRSYADCLRLNISLGGDADTMGAIAGPMAYAYYRKMPQSLIDNARKVLPRWMLDVNDELDTLVEQRGCLKDNLKHWKMNCMKPKYTPEKINHLGPDEIFVFGSNLEGAHMGGAARVAMDKCGAVWGKGIGLQGQCYAIPTMQGGTDTIKPYVDEFIRFAQAHPDLTFLVTRIGCGIAGFRDEEIAPLFREALSVGNIVLPKSFVDCL